MKNRARTVLYHYSFFRVSLLLLFSIVTVISQAQSIWLPNATNKGFGIEYLEPSFSINENNSILSSTQFVSGRYRVSDKFLLVTEFPFANFKSKFSSPEFAFGNPYLGFIMRKSDRPYFMEAGVRAPLASEGNESAMFSGVLSDYYRAEAFLPEMFSLSLKNNYLKITDSNFMLKLMGGLSFWLPTNNDARDPEVIMDYSGHVGFDDPKVQIMGGIGGRLILTEDELDFKERTLHQFAIFARYKAKNVQPGLLIKMPLDEELSNFINFVFGVNLLMNFY